MKQLFIALIVLFALSLTFTSVEAQTPTLTVERLSDNSIRISWNSVDTVGFYHILLVEDGHTNSIDARNFSPYVIATDSILFDRLYNADSIGVAGSNGVGNPVNAIFTDIPNLTPKIPTLSLVEVTATSVELSWTETLGGDSYELFRDDNSVGTTTELTLTDTGLTTGTEYTYHVVAFNADLRGGASNDVIATPLGPPSVTAVRQPDDSILVSWENIPTNGRYYLAHFTGLTTSGIGYDGVSPYIIPANHDNIDRINNAERIGVIATNADNTSFGSYSYAPVPPPNPSVTAVRQADDSILVTWENIPASDGYVVAFFVGDDRTQIAYPSTSPHTIPADHSRIDQVNNAERIGVSAFHPDGFEVGGYVFAPAPARTLPYVTAERLADDSLKLSWGNIRTDTGFYDIYTSTSGEDRLITKVPSSTAEYTFSASSGANFDLVNNAERVGVFGTVGGTGTDQRSEPVPPLNPSVTAERLADNSIKLSWENIRTHEFFIVFNLFVINGDTEAPVNFIPPGDVRSFTFSPTHDNFNEINDADRVGVSGTIDGKSIDKTFADVPPEVILTVERLADDSIELTWENIPTTTNAYSILITKGVTDSYLGVGATSTTITFPPLHSHYDQINNADRIGVIGLENPLLPASTGAFRDVPPIPTVTATRLADHTINLSWENIRSDTLYQIRITENGRDSTLVRTGVSDFTFTPGRNLERVNNAERIGIAGSIAGERVDERFVPVPAPNPPDVNASRQRDNSVLLSWERLVTTDGYSILLIENGATNKIADATSSPYTIASASALFTRVYNAERIGVAGVDSSGNRINEVFTSIPNLSPGTPTLSKVKVTATSVQLSWTAAAGAIEYELFRDDVSIKITRHLGWTDSGLTTGATYTYHVVAFDDIDVNGPNSNDLTVTTVTPAVTSLSFDYNTNGNTVVSFTPLKAGTYTVSYEKASDETDVPTVHTIDSHVNQIEEIKLLTLPGYAGAVIVSFGDAEQVRGTIAVPPAPPTLSVVDTTATDVELEWTAPRGAVSYELFRNDISIAKPAVLTFTDTGLTAGVTYTYHVISVDDSDQESGASNVLTVIPATTPAVNSLSFGYNQAGHTIVSFIALKEGTFTISYETATDETAVDAVTVDVINSQINTTVTATLLTGLGYVGEAVASFGGAEQTRKTIAVPPAPPTLVAVTVTDTTIDLSWDEPRSATSYQIFVNGSPLSSISGTVYFHAGLTPGTEYTYTIESSYDGLTSTRSAELPVTTLVTPTVTAVRTADNSVELSWQGVENESAFGLYAILLVENGATKTFTFTNENPYTISPDDGTAFTRVYNAERIGVGGIDSGSAPINELFTSIPDLTPGVPALSRGAVTANTVTLSWSATLGAVSYELFRDGTSVGTTAELTLTDTGLAAGTHYSYTIRSIDDSSLFSEQSTPLRATTTDGPVTPVTPTVTTPSFTYNTSGNTLVSFIPSTAGSYTISYTIADNNDESTVASVDINALQANSIVAVTLLTSHGYAGTVAVSIGDTEYASNTIAVPPAPPTLVEEDTTATSITLSWNKPRGAVSYELFRGSTSVDTTTELTLTDTGLAPETAYSYTITSTDGTTASAPSTALTASTAPPPVSSFSFTYNDAGRTVVSFTPLEAGSYTINYDPAPSESRVASASFVFSTGQLGGPASAILLTSPGYVGTIDVSFDGVKYESDIIAVPPVPPTLAVGTITDTSIQLTWTAPYGATEYLIYQGSTLVATVFGTSYNHIGLTSNTDYTYTAESRYDTATSVRSEELAVSTLETPVTSDKITDVTHEVLPNGSTNIEFTPTVAATFVITYSDQTVTVEITSVDLETIVNIKTVFGFKGDVVISIGDEVVGQLSIQVPPAPPTLHVGVITDTTVTLSWTAPLGAVSYELFRDGNSVETTTALTFTDTDLTPKTDYTYTITSHDDASQSSVLSDALPVTTSVIPALDSLSFKYISSGHTVISFTPLEEGVYTLRYDPVIGEAVVQSVDIVISASQVGNPATATLLTDSGYAGKFVITFDGVEHASESIQVPIAPPVLRVGTITHTSIRISWDEQHGVTEYLIYEDGNLLDTISATTYLHTGLDPETDYTYTAESTDGTDTTTPSEVLAVTTLETPVILPTDPALAITRLADNSLYLKWKNIPSDIDSYNIHVTESGVTSVLVFRETTEDEYTIFGNSGLPTSRGHFEQANNAERIGVSAFNSGDVTFAPEIPAEIACEDRTPCVMAQRTNNNSVLLSWENVETLTDSYSIFLVEPDSGDFSHNIIVNTTSSSYLFTPSSPSLVSPSDPLFLLIYEADLGIIGVAGVDDDDALINQAFTDVPALTPGIPALDKGAVTSSTVTLSWTATRGADSYELFRNGISIGTTTSTTFTDDTGLNPETAYLYTIESLDDESLASIRSESLSVTTLSGPFTSSEPCPSSDNTPCLKYFPPSSSDDGVTIKLEWNDIETLVTTYAILAVIDGQLEHVTDIDSDIPHSPTGNTVDDYSREYTTSDDDKIQAIYDSLDGAQNICISGASDVDAVRITDADLVCAPQIQVSDPKDGNSDEWKTKPTFGSSWGTQTQLVEAGFVFNGIPLTITDNWHTDFNLTSSIIGENNIVHIKGHASNDFKSVTLSLGIPEIGKKYDAESHITLNLNRNYTAPSDYEITEIIHDQKVELVNESLTSATLSKVKCTPADVVEQCIDFEISFVMMAPLTGEVLAISAMDTRHRETVTFINSGVEFVGESLLLPQTHVLTQKYSNQHPAETIELTQLDRRYQMWEDQNGYLWTQNEYGSWLQITMPDIIQRDDPATSVMTRAHSDFANLVTQEQDRAVLVFNSSDIQGIADEPFTHDEPIRLEKLSDPEVLEILHLQALLAEELLCDCILHED